MTTPLSLGFRVLGSPYEDRRLVDHAAALSAYASCDELADVHREAYISAFTFGDDLRQRADEWGRLDVKGFGGACWSRWLWFDIDRADLDAALRDARRLAATLDERYRLGEDDLLLFFSGSKGFHLGLPTAAWSPAPGDTFHRTARRFVEHVAELAGIAIDSGTYDKARLFRAPNSRHPKTGLHKRRLSLEELSALSLAAILELAKSPEPFDLPVPTGTSDVAAADWQAAGERVADEAANRTSRRSTGTATLNRATFDFIRDGAATGDRHRLLFSAAANLAEFGCPSGLAHALLTEPALDSGLSPSDVRRQIDCGLSAVRRSDAGDQGPPPAVAEDERTSTGSPPSTAGDLRDKLARLWRATPLPTGDTADELDPWDGGEAKGSPPPTPPPDAKLHFADAKGRPCSPDAACRWTWEGAPAWLDVTKTAVPRLRAGGAP